ncbi:MAG: phosphatase PAP2 family protein [Lachnospiraceae bacterium]|nr:phosphatase PAP2 family protein [Lachnospiraceae bacterium]
MMDFLLDLDMNLLLWIQDVVRTPFLDPIFIVITKLGNGGAVWIILSVVLLLNRKTRKIGMMSMMALAGSFLINNLILKNIVERVRPYEVITNLHLLVNRAKDFSFPSGHTGSSFAAAFIFYQELPGKYGIPAMILAGLMGISRLYIGIHYPSDVLAGVVTGIAIAVFVRMMFYNRNKVLP